MHMVSQTTRDLKLRIFGTLVQWLGCSLFSDSAFNMPPTSFTVKATRQTDRDRQADQIIRTPQQPSIKAQSENQSLAPPSDPQTLIHDAQIRTPHSAVTCPLTHDHVRP